MDMKRVMSRAVEIAVVLVGVMLYISRPAHAYVDAGTGSYFLQMAIAMLAGVAFSLKMFWTQIKRGIVARFSAKTNAEKSPVRQTR